MASLGHNALIVFNAIAVDSALAIDHCYKIGDVSPSSEWPRKFTDYLFLKPRTEPLSIIYDPLWIMMNGWAETSIAYACTRLTGPYSKHRH